MNDDSLAKATLVIGGLSLLISYLSLEETKRHNAVTEQSNK